MAEVRTVKIHDLDIDKRGNVSKKDNEFRIITEADYLANHVEHPNEDDPMRYRLYSESRAKSGHHPEADYQEEQKRKLEERIAGQKEGDVAKRVGTGTETPGVKKGQRDAKSGISGETPEGEDKTKGKGKDKDKEDSKK